jgi:hypothetical protein
MPEIGSDGSAMNSPVKRFYSAFAEFLQRPAPTRFHSAVAAITIFVSCFLLFARLGHYALWDDEAQTALFAQGVWKTGDTSALLGDNVLASRDGACLTNLKGRYEPPLQHYVLAPFAGLWPGSALAVRIPCACFGLVIVFLIFAWLRREQATLLVYLLTAMGLIGNVSFWLYCRQCRYYSMEMLLSVVIAFLYFSRVRRRWTVPLIGVLSACLFATHYLDYAAFYAMLAVDWLLWGRHRFKLSVRDWLWLSIPQLAIGSVVFSIWDPLVKVVSASTVRGKLDRLILFGWAWRDMNRCEFGVLLLVAAAPVVWIFRREILLLRGPLALVVYVAVVELLSPQQAWGKVDGTWQQITTNADVRYLAACIPLIIAINVLVLTRAVPRRICWLSLLIGAIAFGTNAMQGGFLLKDDPLQQHEPLMRSTLALYVAELCNPPDDPYRAAATWINANIPPGDSILVAPDFMMYPLMFHSPNFTYAWQIPYPPSKQFENLRPINFRGQLVPDYVICFGPMEQQVFNSGLFPQGTQAQRIEALDVFSEALYRPELFWRIFRPIKGFDPNIQGIKIWRLSAPASSLDFHL